MSIPLQNERKNCNSMSTNHMFDRAQVIYRSSLLLPTYINKLRFRLKFEGANEWTKIRKSNTSVEECKTNKSHWVHPPR